MNVLPSWRLRARHAACAATVGAAVLGACSNTPPPSDQLAVADAALERATGPAAAEAPVELAAARDKLARAHAAYAAREFVLARQLAEQAEADATLAEAKARAARAGRALAEVKQGIAQMRAEVPRP